jgi:hypothetical protein
MPIPADKKDVEGHKKHMLASTHFSSHQQHLTRDNLDSGSSISFQA